MYPQPPPIPPLIVSTNLDNSRKGLFWQKIWRNSPFLDKRLVVIAQILLQKPGHRVRMLFIAFRLEISKYTRLHVTQSYGGQCDSTFNSFNGRVVRASASGAVDLGFIPSRVKPMTLKLVFTGSMLDVEH